MNGKLGRTKETISKSIILGGLPGINEKGNVIGIAMAHRHRYCWWIGRLRLTISSTIALTCDPSTQLGCTTETYVTIISKIRYLLTRRRRRIMNRL